MTTKQTHQSLSAHITEDDAVDPSPSRALYAPYAVIGLCVGILASHILQALTV